MLEGMQELRVGEIWILQMPDYLVQDRFFNHNRSSEIIFLIVPIMSEK